MASVLLRVELEVTREHPSSSQPLNIGESKAQFSALSSISIHFLGHPIQWHEFDNICVLIILNPDSCVPCNPDTRISNVTDTSNLTYPNWKADFQPPKPASLSVFTISWEQDFRSSVLSLSILQLLSQNHQVPQFTHSWWEALNKKTEAQGLRFWQQRAVSYSSGNDLRVLAISNQIFFHLLEKVWDSKSWENVHGTVVTCKKTGISKM